LVVFLSNFEILVVHEKLVEDWSYVPEKKRNKVGEHVYQLNLTATPCWKNILPHFTVLAQSHEEKCSQKVAQSIGNKKTHQHISFSDHFISVA